MKHRVLHVIDHTGSGGAQVVIRHILHTLKDQYSFAVAVLGTSGKYSEAYETLGIPVFVLGPQGSRWNPSPALGLVDIIHRGRFGLVHTHLFKAHVLGTIAARWVGSKTIIHDHSSIYPQTLQYHISNRFVRRSYMYAYRYALSQCDRVLVLRPEDVHAYEELYSFDPHRITALPNAVDPDEFRPPSEPPRGRWLRQELNLAAETRLIVMVGRLVAQKNWLTFLQVAQTVTQQSDQPCRFLIIGSGPEEQPLRDYVTAHKLEHVCFLSHRDDVPSLLQQADVFLFTSQHETFGIAVLEAMAAGCPVVATRSAGPESILTDGVDGLLTEVGDVPGLTKRVLRLLQDRAICQRLVCTARRTVLERYSLEAMAPHMASIYADILRH